MPETRSAYSARPFPIKSRHAPCLFNTLLDVNKFVCKVTLRRYFRTCGFGTENGDKSGDHRVQSKTHEEVNNGSLVSFREYCCLSDLQHESITDNFSNSELVGKVAMVNQI